MLITLLSFALLTFAIFIYSANPKEGVNKWCSITIIIFFIGNFSEAITTEIMPAFGWYNFEKYFILFQNISTWIMFSMTMPTATVTAFYLSYIDIRKKWRIVKYLVFVPCFFLALFFSPTNFLEYGPISTSFWITYSIYILMFSILLIAIIIRGVIFEEKLNKEGSILKKKRNRKMQEALILLPSLYFPIFYEFPVRLYDALFLNTVNNSFKPFWQLHIVIIFICLFGAVYFSVNGGGFLGIRILPARYNYKFQMLADNFLGNFIQRIKNETSYMIVKINKINDALDSGKNNIDKQDVISNLNELSEKIHNLNAIAKKFSRYSSNIRLNFAFWNLVELLNCAKRTDTKTLILIDDKVCLECDGNIMTEVFKDIIDNSIQSIEARNMQEAGKIVISETRDMNKYKITITDNGVGIPPNKLESIFYPGETTKNTEYNSGMGLSNCKKIIQDHGGDIFAESEGVGKGASIIIALPYKIVDIDGKNLVNANKIYTEVEDAF